MSAKSPSPEEVSKSAIEAAAKELAGKEWDAQQDVLDFLPMELSRDSYAANFQKYFSAQAEAAIQAYLAHVNEAFPDTADPGDDYNWEDLEAREAVYRIALGLGGQDV